MAQNVKSPPVIGTDYDVLGDILTFSFTETPQPAVAEEVADEVWVRYDLKSHRVITLDILNFSARVQEAFGPSLTYSERIDPQRIESLTGLPLPQG